MISGSIEFFNVAEIRGGVLYRFPLLVCDALQIPEFDAEGNFLRVHTGHRASARALYGAELRFAFRRFDGACRPDDSTWNSLDLPDAELMAAFSDVRIWKTNKRTTKNERQ